MVACKKTGCVSYATCSIQLHCFESTHCCSKSLDLFTKYKSNGISWHLNDIGTADPLRYYNKKSSWLLDCYYNTLFLETYQLLCLLRPTQELALLFVNRGLGVQGSGSKCNLLHLVSENRKQLDLCYEPQWLHCLDSRVLSALTIVTGALY